MNHVRNPAGTIVGRSSKIKTSQSLHDPFRDPPITKFIRSSTFWKTWPAVCFFLLEAGIIALYNRPAKSLQLSSTILTVLGTVIGFAISYRTSSAYAQYNEARKAWGTVIHHSRTLSRLIWLHVPNELTPHTTKEPATEDEKLRAMTEKKTMINLVQAFSVSLKHYLRGEYGIYYEDLYHLLCILPKYNQVGPKSLSGVPQLPGKFRSQDSSFVVEVEKAYSILSEDGVPRPSSLFQGPTVQPADPMNPPMKLLPGYNPPRKTLIDRFPFLRVFKSLIKGSKNACGVRQASDRRYCPGENIPLEILWHMSIYLSTLQARKVIDVPTTNTFNATLVGLSDALTNVERVLTTPIPFGYLVHLNTIIYGYLTFLPFQLVGAFKKIVVPATALIAFAFLGFMKIAQDIENPFGYSSNDLDLDHFCNDIILRELMELTAIPPLDPMNYVMTSSNIPLFESGCFQTAPEILNSLLPADLEYLLSEPVRIRKEESSTSSGTPPQQIKVQNKN
ncbi:hypothetical protein PTTG_29921 [Puccinia triticina 1-1 BBBD Race 1]|uniref:Uncharacterized protein n=2 Tax=Puccinia triticina TaxID=208348 RepID=A0A180G3L0_PUCT1|nr:uncharacterized protein PtA15_16A29 [Puccinia triticina]OAV86413.1 hypothetical protein PTTG_29921 [Puccinia triticina 1-1 BBBD Race 1]WAQ92124.1 hypothetical protein PtA15_16A29 [Puccinia triticina]WAR63871.1 hypothetical protein PtB15_16B30 [Puccinia triticina]